EQEMALVEAEPRVGADERAACAPALDRTLAGRGQHGHLESALELFEVDPFGEAKPEQDALCEESRRIERLDARDERAFAIEGLVGSRREPEVAFEVRRVAIANGAVRGGKGSERADSQPEVRCAAPVAEVVARFVTGASVVADLVVVEPRALQRVFDRREA